MTIRILQMNNDFQPLGRAIPKPAEKAADPVEIKPGIVLRPDGTLATNIPTKGPRVAPPVSSFHECDTCKGEGHIDLTLGGESFSDPKSRCPDCDGNGEIPTALHGGWIEFAGGGCPIPDALAGEYEVRVADGEERIYENLRASSCRGWFMRGFADKIIAYRLLA